MTGFDSGPMTATTETPYQVMLAALGEIVRNYERTDMSHVDFRVSACQIASAAVANATGQFPQPQRRDGKEPCGECRLQDGETCDICGAKA